MDGLLDFFLWFIPIVILDCFWITDYFKTHEKWRKESFITVIVLNLIFFDIGYFNARNDRDYQYYSYMEYPYPRSRNHDLEMTFRVLVAKFQTTPLRFHVKDSMAVDDGMLKDYGQGEQYVYIFYGKKNLDFIEYKNLINFQQEKITDQYNVGGIFLQPDAPKSDSDTLYYDIVSSDDGTNYGELEIDLLTSYNVLNYYWYIDKLPAKK